KNTDALSYQTFTVSALQTLAPFTANPPHLDAVSIIDSVTSLDVDYQEPSGLIAMTSLAKTLLSTAASRRFAVHTDRVDVGIDGVNRLKIPGSFKVHLLKDGKRIASKGFFQPDEADKCETCVQNAIVHFDFELPLADVENGKLEVAIEPIDKTIIGDRFPDK